MPYTAAVPSRYGEPYAISAFAAVRVPQPRMNLTTSRKLCRQQRSDKSRSNFVKSESAFCSAREHPSCLPRLGVVFRESRELRLHWRRGHGLDKVCHLLDHARTLFDHRGQVLLLTCAQHIPHDRLQKNMRANVGHFCRYKAISPVEKTPKNARQDKSHKDIEQKNWR
jgi:hypothetical protein